MTLKIEVRSIILPFVAIAVVVLTRFGLAWYGHHYGNIVPMCGFNCSNRLQEILTDILGTWVPGLFFWFIIIAILKIRRRRKIW